MSTGQDKVEREFPKAYPRLLKELQNATSWDGAYKILCLSSYKDLDPAKRELLLAIQAGQFPPSLKDIFVDDLHHLNANGENIVFTCVRLMRWHEAKGQHDMAEQYKEFLKRLYNEQIAKRDGYYKNNDHDENGNTQLHWAVAMGQVNGVQQIIAQKKINVHTRNHDELTAFDLAVQLDYREIQKLLGAAGVMQKHPELPAVPTPGPVNKELANVLEEAREQKDSRILEEFFFQQGGVPEAVLPLVERPQHVHSEEAHIEMEPVLDPLPDKRKIVAPVPRTPIIFDNEPSTPLKRTASSLERVGTDSPKPNTPSSEIFDPALRETPPPPQKHVDPAEGEKFLEFLARWVDKKFRKPNIRTRTKLKMELIRQILAYFQKPETKLDLGANFNERGIMSTEINLYSQSFNFTPKQLALLENPEKFTLSKALQFKRNKSSLGPTRSSEQFQKETGLALKAYAIILLKGIVKTLNKDRVKKPSEKEAKATKIKHINDIITQLRDTPIQTLTELCEFRVDEQQPNLLKVLMTHRNTAKNPKMWNAPQLLTIQDLRAMEKTDSYKTLSKALHFDEHFTLDNILEMLVHSIPIVRRDRNVNF